MELLPFVREQDPEFIFGGVLEVWHGGYDGVEVEPWIYVTYSGLNPFTFSGDIPSLCR